MAYKKSEPTNKNKAPVPSSALELGTRIKFVLDLYENRASAARVAGKSVDMLTAYTKGRVAAPFEVLVNLALDKDIELRWLATGEGEPHARRVQVPYSDPPRSLTVDEELLGKISDGVARIYKEEGARLAPVDQGRLSARLLNKLTEAYEDPWERAVGLKLALEELRRDLRSAPVADAPTSKRSA
jgi:hypothetical protein